MEIEFTDEDFERLLALPLDERAAALEELERALRAELDAAAKA